MATVAGLFRNQNDVNCALQALNQNGYGQKSISIAAPEDAIESNPEYEKYMTYTDIDQAGAGILLTVVTEEGRHLEVKHLLQDCHAVEVDTRYGLWDKGGIEDYVEATDESREERSTNE